MPTSSTNDYELLYKDIEIKYYELSLEYDEFKETSKMYESEMEDEIDYLNKKQSSLETKYERLLKDKDTLKVKSDSKYLSLESDYEKLKKEFSKHKETGKRAKRKLTELEILNEEYENSKRISDTTIIELESEANKIMEKLTIIQMESEMHKESEHVEIENLRITLRDSESELEKLRQKNEEISKKQNLNENQANFNSKNCTTTTKLKEMWKSKIRYLSNSNTNTILKNNKENVKLLRNRHKDKFDNNMILSQNGNLIKDIVKNSDIDVGHDSKCMMESNSMYILQKTPRASQNEKNYPRFTPINGRTSLMQESPPGKLQKNQYLSSNYDISLPINVNKGKMLDKYKNYHEKEQNCKNFGNLWPQTTFTHNTETDISFQCQDHTDLLESGRKDSFGSPKRNTHEKTNTMVSKLCEMSPNLSGIFDNQDSFKNQENSMEKTDRSFNLSFFNDEKCKGSNPQRKNSYLLKNQYKNSNNSQLNISSISNTSKNSFIEAVRDSLYKGRNNIHKILGVKSQISLMDEKLENLKVSCNFEEKVQT